MAQMDVGNTTGKKKTARETEVLIGNGGTVSFYSPTSTISESQSGGNDVLTKLHKNLDRLDGLVGRLRFVMSEIKNSVSG